ncbi:hypothetical protein [Pseudaminobacter sp. NGMCC 1.201702]|uniref:hypothetical protein n=1 Tax=Pseudaminobacter sp. NGMCC 1.201702 TaxID=3391825 RepID=UPI0039EF3372
MVFVPKVVDGECREFVVVPPVGVQFDEPALQERIVEALRDEFPESGFTLVDTAAARDEEFRIIPVLSATDAGPVSRMPAESVTEEIDSFLALNFATIPAPKLQ